MDDEPPVDSLVPQNTSMREKQELIDFFTVIANELEDDDSGQEYFDLELPEDIPELYIGNRSDSPLLPEECARRNNFFEMYFYFSGKILLIDFVF